MESLTKMYRVLLIYPPSRTQLHHSCPMGIQMIAAVLEKAGYQVYLIDANAARNRRTCNEIVEIAHELKPDIIGMTLLTPIIKESYHLVSRLKNTNAKFIAGGPHATIIPEEAIRHGFDAVVIGEGEATVEEAIKALLGLMPKDDVFGWVYKDDKGHPIWTKPRPLITDLDDLPLPARHLVNPKDYGDLNNHSLHGNIFSSRGCPAKCSFCSGGLFGKNFRFRSAQSIIDEIKYVHKMYSTNHFYFVDDAATINKDRIRQICDKLIECNLPITWDIMTRIDTVNEELLQLLACAGCTEIHFGVESGDPETLKKIHKPHTVEMVKRIIPITAKFGIKPVAFFIFGFPWEKTEHIENTLHLMHELSPYVDHFHPAIASVIIPFPGTEIYEQYKEEYHLENWWLTDNKTYGAPDVSKQPYFMMKIFWAGNVLEADFFRYTNEMKQKIYDIFMFMYKFNLKKHPSLLKIIFMVNIDLSQKLHTNSPKMEHILFTPIKHIEQLVRKV